MIFSIKFYYLCSHLSDPPLRDSLEDWTLEFEEMRNHYEKSRKKCQQVLERRRDSVEAVRRKCAQPDRQSEMHKLLQGKI